MKTLEEIGKNNFEVDQISQLNDLFAKLKQSSFEEVQFKMIVFIVNFPLS